MRVCIYGAEAIGCCFAGRVHRGGARARAAGCHPGPEGAAA